MEYDKNLRSLWSRKLRKLIDLIKFQQKEVKAVVTYTVFEDKTDAFLE